LTDGLKSLFPKYVTISQIDRFKKEKIRNRTLLCILNCYYTGVLGPFEKVQGGHDLLIPPCAHAYEHGCVHLSPHNNIQQRIYCDIE